MWFYMEYSHFEWFIEVALLRDFWIFWHNYLFMLMKTACFGSAHQMMRLPNVKIDMCQRTFNAFFRFHFIWNIGFCWSLAANRQKIGRNFLISAICGHKPYIINNAIVEMSEAQLRPWLAFLYGCCCRDKINSRP